MTERDIVAHLVKLRVKSGMTQADVAARIGVVRSTVARFETDCLRRKSPTLFILSRYTQAVGAKVTIEAA